MPSNDSRYRRRSRRTVAASAGVERGEGLVEQQQPGVGGERAGKRGALRLPARQRARVAGRRTRRARPGRATRGRCVGRRPSGSCERAARRRRSRARSCARTAGSSGTRTRSGGPRARRSVSVAGSSTTTPSIDDRPAVERREPGQAAQHGALAGAVRAEQRRATRPARPRCRPAGRACRAATSICADNVMPRTSPCGSVDASEPAVAEPDEHDEGDRDQQQREHDRLFRVGLQREVHGERHRLCGPREVAGEGDRRAELAECSRPGQHGAGTERRADRRHRDPPERVPARRPEGARRVLEAECPV